MAIPEDIMERVFRVQKVVREACEREGLEYVLMMEPQGHRTGAIVLSSESHKNKPEELIRFVRGMAQRLDEQLKNNRVELHTRSNG